VLDKAEYSAFESTLNSYIISNRIVHLLKKLVWTVGYCISASHRGILFTVSSRILLWAANAGPRTHTQSWSCHCSADTAMLRPDITSWGITVLDTPHSSKVEWKQELAIISTTFRTIWARNVQCHHSQPKTHR